MSGTLHRPRCLGSGGRAQGHGALGFDDVFGDDPREGHLDGELYLLGELEVVLSIPSAGVNSRRPFKGGRGG